jgi:hypothetical protein
MRTLYDALEIGPKTKRERYEQLEAALWSERSSFDAHWMELGDWLLPTRTRFWTSQRNQGGKRNQNIIDSTGRFALRTLSSGMHAGLTSPARPWFKLTTPDPDLAKFKPVQEWLEIVTQRMNIVFADANLYLSFPTLYTDIGAFGTSAMGMLPDAEDLFRCYNYPLGSYALGMDERGKVAIFVRRYELSVLQLVKTFGVELGSREIDWSRFSSTVKTLWDRGNYTASIEVCWIVQPNEAYQEGRLGPRGFKFSSCHFERGSSETDGRFLRESGYDTFPIMAPRWEITGEDSYGTDCPGMTALGDVRQLQIQHKDKGRAIKKQIDPPVQGPPELRTQKTSLLPGDITYVRDSREGGGLRSVHDVNLNLGDLREDMADTRYRIKTAFYEPLFLMMAQSDQTLGAERPTAREIDERHEEKLLALGPVLERTGDELLDPVIDRAFAMMQQSGLLPPPPSEVQGVRLKVEYISIMAQAQKLAGVVAQDRFLLSTVNLAATYPEARHKVIVFRAIDNYRDMYGVDPRMIRSDEEAQQLAQQEQQQLAQAQAAANAAQMGKGLKDAAAAPMGTDSALDRLVGAAAAQ